MLRRMTSALFKSGEESEYAYEYEYDEDSGRLTSAAKNDVAQTISYSSSVPKGRYSYSYLYSKGRRMFVPRLTRD